MTNGSDKRRYSDGDIKGVDDTESLGTTVPDALGSEIDSDFSDISIIGSTPERLAFRHRGSSLSVADEWSSCERPSVARFPLPSQAMASLPPLPAMEDDDFLDDDYDPTSLENIEVASAIEIAETTSQTLQNQIRHIRSALAARDARESGSEVLQRYGSILRELETEYAECMDNINRECERTNQDNLNHECEITHQDDINPECENEGSLDVECAQEGCDSDSLETIPLRRRLTSEIDFSIDADAIPELAYL